MESGSMIDQMEGMRFYKFFQEPDCIVAEDVSDEDSWLSPYRIPIPTNGGLIVDPKESFFHRTKKEYEGYGLYFCDQSSVLYYFTYGDYVAEVFPIRSEKIKTSSDEGAMCYYAPRIMIGPVKKVTRRFLLKQVKAGCPLVFYDREYDRYVMPLVNRTYAKLHEYGKGKPILDELIEEVLIRYYMEFPADCIEQILSHLSGKEFDYVLFKLVSKIMSHHTDLSQQDFRLINVIHRYYISVKRGKYKLDLALIPVEWLLFRLYKQYPHVFAITVGSFPEFKNLEAGWKEHGFRAPNGFLYIV